MYSIHPNSEKLPQIFDNIPSNTPIVMINLLRFRDKAEYPADSGFEACSGEEAYARYSKEALAFVTKVGGAPIWMAETVGDVIAPAGEHWDRALLVKYPSKESFIGMAMNDAYKQCTIHRTAALLDARLIASIEKM